MAALFSHRADLIFRAVLVSAGGIPTLAMAGLMFIARSPLATRQFEPVSQPVQFDHRHHVADEGIDCQYC